MPRYFNPRTVAAPASRYSHGVTHGARANRLVVAGQVAMRLDGSVPQDLEAQMELVWDNFLEVLKEGGMGASDVIKVVMYCTVPGSAALARRVRQRKLGAQAPAATYLEVTGLAAPDYLFEVEGEAVSEDPASIYDDNPDFGLAITRARRGS
jgi:2-iminobutanoate/2-iminopropanoate deaminase